MNPEIIKAKIRIKYGTMLAFAEILGVCPESVYGAINGKNRSRPIERAIAKDLGTTVEELFPDRYQTELAS